MNTIQIETGKVGARVLENVEKYIHTQGGRLQLLLKVAFGMTNDEIAEKLSDHGVHIGKFSIYNHFKSERITKKKLRDGYEKVVKGIANAKAWNWVLRGGTDELTAEILSTVNGKKKVKDVADGPTYVEEMQRLHDAERDVLLTRIDRQKRIIGELKERLQGANGETITEQQIESILRKIVGSDVASIGVSELKRTVRQKIAHPG